MASGQDPAQVHCYTNPSFCRQSEYIPEDGRGGDAGDLPPPPQFQIDDLPPPPPVLQPQPQYGQSNPAFHGSPETNLAGHPAHHRSVANLNHTTGDRYCYIDEGAEGGGGQPSPGPVFHKRYGSLPLGGHQRGYAFRSHRYEYIQDDAAVPVQVQQPPAQQQHPGPAPPPPPPLADASRYEYLEQPELQRRPAQQLVRRDSARASTRSYVGPADGGHYPSLGHEPMLEPHEVQWSEEEAQAWNASRRQISTPRGRYTSLPLQDEEPPCLPERNGLEGPGQRVNNIATQKLHEILTTPRKPRMSRSQADLYSPMKSPQRHQQQQPAVHNVLPSQRGGVYTPGCSPSSTAAHRAMNSPSQPQHRPQPQQQQQQQQQAGTPPSRALSPRQQGPTTSTPNKEPPSARRCLPLSEASMVRRHIEDSRAAQAAAAYGRLGQGQRPIAPAYPDEAGLYAEQRKKQASGFYQSVESAFIARTAVVPPLSPPMSEANTTLVSVTEKSERKNAPLILVLVGVLTCGLAIYLSWTQGRKYYFDSAIGCGVCCALAGACRSMRRTWTGLGLAGLAALSCAGLLLLAAKSPRPGTPMHDVTAGALCGVSLLGAVLALLALIAPRCTFGRHRRVHSWIPRFSP